MVHCTVGYIIKSEITFKSRVAGEHVKASTKRSSKVCYLSDEESRLSAVLSKRIGDVTGLHVKNNGVLTKNSEDLQVSTK